MLIKLLSPADAANIINYYVKNADHLRAWEPIPPTEFEDIDFWYAKLVQRETEMKTGKAVYFAGFDEQTHSIIALCSLTNIVYGAFKAVYMGYSIDADHEGTGQMKTLCYHTIDHAFNKLHLHRIMANYMPHNTRSASLLNRLGFVIEGKAKQYLNINGLWEDHILTSLISTKKR